MDCWLEIGPVKRGRGIESERKRLFEPEGKTGVKALMWKWFLDEEKQNMKSKGEWECYLCYLSQMSQMMYSPYLHNAQNNTTERYQETSNIDCRSTKRGTHILSCFSSSDNANELITQSFGDQNMYVQACPHDQ